MATNTNYAPTNVNDFEAKKLSFASQGVSCSPAVGTTTNLDLTLTDDHLITGLELIVNDATLGDYIFFQVVDTSGAFSGTPGTVLLQPATNWFVYTSTNTQFDIIYPAKVYAGLTLRIVYHSTGAGSPFLAVNYKLHKVLI